MHIRGTDQYGSPERLIIGQMRHMSDVDSVAASFVRSGVTNQFLVEVERAGLRGTEIKEDRKFDRRLPGRLKALIRELSVDLMVTHEYKSSVYGYLARRRLGVPQICYFHGWTSEDARVKVYNALDRMVLRRADRIVTVSRASADRLVRHGVAHSKIEVVYNAIDVDPVEQAPERTPNERTVIGVIGRLSQEKGIHVLLDALARVRQENRSFTVRLIGSGPEEARLKSMADRLALNDCVTFEGFRNDLGKVYPQLDFLVLPSLSEGHPVVILEAWKHGVGVLATRAGGIPEVIRHEETGLLTEVNRSDSLAETIARALDDIPLMNKFGRAGFNELRNRFSYPKQAELLSAIYRATIEDHKTKA